jgi:hypothetical protein
MTKELVKPGKHEVALPVKSMGAGDDVRATDLKIGRISIAQAMSKAVAGDLVRKGSLYDNETKVELAYKTELPLEVILLKSFRYWIIKEKVGTKENYVKRIPGNDHNEFAREDGNIRRYYHHAFIVLLVKDIAEGIEMPYEIAFRSSDLTAAASLSKYLLNLRRKNISSLERVFTLTTSTRTKDDNTWFGTDVALGRETTKVEQKVSEDWCAQLNDVSKNIKTVEEENFANENARF